MSYRLSDIISRLGGELRGADVLVQRIAPSEEAVTDDITFLANLNTKLRYWQAMLVR